MRLLGGAAAAAGVLVLLTGCTSPGDATTSGAPTVTTTTTLRAPVSSAPASSAAATPSGSASASAPPSTAGAADDPGRPTDQCPDSAIGVEVAPASGGGAAGSRYFDVLFTNTSGSSCVLRGTPGVSVVGKGNGTQLGPAADRVQTGAKDVRLGVGQTVTAPLKVVDIGTNGGPLPNCRVVHGDGYRVYPPHSRKAYFVKDATAVACADGPVFMTASPVIPFTD